MPKAMQRSQPPTDGEPGAAGQQLHLAVRSGRHAGASLVLALPLRGPLVIGSDIGCDLVLSDDGIAAAHAMCFERDLQLWLVAMPGSPPGSLTARERVMSTHPAPLAAGTLLRIGNVDLEVEDGYGAMHDGADDADEPEAPAALPTPLAPARRRGGVLSRSLASAFFIVAGALLLVLSLGAVTPARSLSPPPYERAVPATREEETPGPAHAAARHIERYLGESGVRVTVEGASRIVLTGEASSQATRLRVEKMRRVMPTGLEFVDRVSYWKKDPAGDEARVSLPLSKLGPKILQIAASEPAPYIEINDGERVFEGGQLNGFEVIKIAPREILAQRGGKIHSFTLE